MPRWAAAQATTQCCCTKTSPTSLFPNRIGSAVELIQHLLGPNQRPTGQRGMYMYPRYGSDSVNYAAFRMLVA